MTLFLSIFGAALFAVLLGGLAINVSPKQSVLDGLLLIVIWFVRQLKKLFASPDVWEAMKAFFSSMILSGSVVFGVLSASDPTALSVPDFRFYTAAGLAVGFVGVAFSSRMQRKLLAMSGKQ